MGSFLAHALMALKRAIRPLVPDRLVARFRRPSRPGWARTNVDILVDEDAQVWLRSTPDTYRVLRLPVGPAEEAASGWTIETTDNTIASDHMRPVMGSGSYSGVVLARAAPPRVNRGSYQFPVIEPLAIGLPREALDEVGGRPSGDDDLAGLFFRLLNAGRPLALLPRGAPVASSPVIPGHPIERDLSVVIMAGVPLHDVGGGFRGAQLARELAKAGAHVTYVHEYDSGESVDLGLRIIHPAIEELRADWFEPDRFADRVHSSDRLVIVEFPHTDIVAAAARLQRHGYRLCYDVIDDWSDRALGGMWWAAEYEEALLAAADVVTASAPALAKRVEAFASGHTPLLVPNAVNPDIFGADRPAPAADIPPGTGPLFSYHGSLYGDWLDWGAIASLAEAYPEARVVMIGDERSHPPMPANVHFLGLRPQSSLPGYLVEADVSLIPFKLNETTHAVSPLKAFEAMAMGVRVAAPPLESLEGLDGVYTNADLVEAVAAARAGQPPSAEQARREHAWSDRVATILAGVGIDPPAERDPRVPLVVERPPVSYSEDERSIGFS